MRYLLLIAALFTVSTQASALPDFPFMTVSATAERDVKPDKATLELTLLAFNESSEQAHQEMLQATQNVLKLIAELNIEDRHITAHNIHKSVTRARTKEYQDTNILGYNLIRDFRIELDDLSKFSPLMKGLLEAQGIMRVDSKFDVSNREEILSALIAEAAKKARSKADQMASGLGVKIDSVFAFNDSGSFDDVLATFGLSEDFSVTAYRRSPPPPGMELELIFIPESITVRKKINVIYKIGE